MKRILQGAIASLLLGTTVAFAPGEPASAPVPTDSVAGEVRGVVLVDFRFQPAEVTVRVGDVVQFVQRGIQPHNVQFRTVPKGVDLGNEAMGPFLVQKGQTYRLKIDARFKPGVYEFVCTPHEMMGMKGRLVVVGG